MDFPKEEYEQRWARVYGEMSKRGYSTLVVWQRSGGSYDRAGHVWWLASYASQQSGQRAQRLWNEAGYAFGALIFHEGREPELHINEPLEIIDRSRLPISHVQYHDNLFFGVAP